MIVTPHGLAADILRALQSGEWMTTGAIVDAIDEAHGVGEEEPGVGWSTTWHQLDMMTWSAPYAVQRERRIDGSWWRLRRG